HVDPSDLHEIVAAADLAIGAGGTSSFERAACGLPSVLIPIADNQRFIAAAFKAAGAAKIVPAAMLDDPSALGAAIAGLAADNSQRAAMSKAAATITDGRGAQRLLVACAGIESAKDGTSLRLRLVEPSDAAWLLSLQSQPETRRFSYNPAVPSAQEHAAWFARVLENDDRLLAIAEANGERAGMVRLDRVGRDPDTFEVSIAVDQARHGRGFGKAVLALARRLAPGADFIANVLPQNRASVALFTAAGYRQESGDRYRSRAA
ncbi:MAG: GNAT family N-acetyltransferase, partial [Pseudorhodoplanes sp.]